MIIIFESFLGIILLPLPWFIASTAYNYASEVISQANWHDWRINYRCSLFVPVGCSYFATVFSTASPAYSFMLLPDELGWTIIFTGMADLILVNSKFTASVFAATFRHIHSRGVHPSVLYPAVNVEQFDGPCTYR